MNLSAKSACNLICILILFLFSTELIFCNSGIQLLDPPNGSGGQQLELTFTWSGDVSGGTFELQIARDPAFTNLFADARFITANEYPYQLADEGAYFWRVRKVVDNAVNPEEWSEIFVFKTISTPQPIQQRPDSKNSGEKQLSTIDLLIPLDGSFTLAMPRNDDGSSSLITLPFSFNFFGTNYNQLYINNNGNISFDSPYYEYIPTGFPSSSYRMIAPFWADVDTRNGGSGEVWYRSEEHRLVVIWSNVGYYRNRIDKLNDFELIISDGTPDGGLPNGMHVCFNYGDMEWTTGDASGGSGGFGGSPATVGMNRGDGSNYRQIGRFDHPGSDYDGAFGANDGVDWLDGRIIYFRNDYNPPVALCQNVTLSLDDNGSVVVQPEDIDDGSSDGEGGIESMNVSPNTFDCSSIGTHTVTLTITDENYNVASCTAEVTIVDDTPPTVSCNDISVTLDENNYASITYIDILNEASDNCTIDRYELSQSEFSCDDVGENEIILTVYDVNGNSTECTSTLTVIDAVYPEITVVADPSILWPPNHKMATITTEVTISDNCPGSFYKLTSVVSNEPDNELGDGDTPDDIQGLETGTADNEFSLRKERSGTGTGRIYTITYTAYDVYGNSTVGTAEVLVPHDWDKKGIFDNIPSDFLVSSVPNPFNDKTTIVYNLDASTDVGIEILDVLGNKVYSEPKKSQNAGVYSFVWFGMDMSGNVLPTGLYFIKLDYGNQSSIVPMTILR